MTPSIRYLLGLLSLSIVVLDQVTKLSVMETMRLHESIPVITNLFSITYIRNPGAAFDSSPPAAAHSGLCFSG